MVIFYLIICALLKFVYSENITVREMTLKDHDFAILSLFKDPQIGKGAQLFHLLKTYNERLEKLTEMIDTDYEEAAKVIKVLCKLRGPVFFNTKYDDDAIARTYDFRLNEIHKIKELTSETKDLYKRMKYAYECKAHRMGRVLQKDKKSKDKPIKRSRPHNCKAKDE